MKTTVTIINNSGIVASKTVNGTKQVDAFVKANVPAMKMEDKIKEGWKVFTS